MRIAVQHELPFWVGMATIGLGAIVAVQGQPDEGLARLQSGLEVYIGAGARLGLAQALVAVAEANGKVGHYEEAFSALAQAEALSETSGGDDHVAEIARVRGMLLLRQATAAPPASRQRRKPGARTSALDRPPHSSAVAAAEASLLRALSIAQEQGSRAWELRAATSLAALWKGGSKSHDGRTLLAGVLGRFTEGADTADVRNARTLLTKLG